MRSSFSQYISDLPELSQSPCSGVLSDSNGPGMYMYNVNISLPAILHADVAVGAFNYEAQHYSDAGLMDEEHEDSGPDDDDMETHLDVSTFLTSKSC